MLSWLVHDQGIEPDIPVFDKSARKYGTNGRLCHLTARTKESRDALCASQAHPENGPSPIARPDRSPRRVPPRSHRPEPQKDGQTDPDDATVARRLIGWQSNL